MNFSFIRPIYLFIVYLVLPFSFKRKGDKTKTTHLNAKRKAYSSYKSLDHMNMSKIDLTLGDQIAQLATTLLLALPSCPYILLHYPGCIFHT